jgi:hypothetical protein
MENINKPNLKNIKHSNIPHQIQGVSLSLEKIINLSHPKLMVGSRQCW